LHRRGHGTADKAIKPMVIRPAGPQTPFIDGSVVNAIGLARA
jgi:hypothetical protein